ncbi:Bug family tripartite tricarboxylate transporter substrate binding protein [Mesobacterium pallidum]|uniref:Bug family tripartite tricarboxylate transporter substrate binding protein n=1 Tax=Mesobacterium pallidum TaxID=2872037 RepID=UPI001EE3660D|nr:tripartite tricarboxylate transporter substrate-binding protein [Mesobacterium pallidum]
MKTILNSAITALALSTGAAAAQDFPQRTIELIYPWGPGNAMAVSQILAKAMSDELGVSVPVISTPGAAGTKAFLTAMNKPADGYTIIDGYVAPLVLQPVLGKADWTYEDFIPLHSAFSNAFALGVRAGEDRWATFEEMMAYCKEHPGELRYTSGSRNNLPHMVTAKALQGYDCVAQNIPYSANAEGMSDLKNGVLDFGIVNVGEFQQAGDQYNILLVLSELPESAEIFGGAASITDLGIDLGLSGLAPMGWDWWMVTKDTPQDRVDVLRDVMAKALARPEVQDKIKALGFVPLKWDYDQYAEIVGPVAGQLEAMGNALKWEEEQLAKQ